MQMWLLYACVREIAVLNEAAAVVAEETGCRPADHCPLNAIKHTPVQHTSFTALTKHQCGTLPLSACLFRMFLPPCSGVSWRLCLKRYNAQPHNY